MSKPTSNDTHPPCSLSENKKQPQSQYLVQLIAEVSKVTKKRSRSSHVELVVDFVNEKNYQLYDGYSLGGIIDPVNKILPEDTYVDPAQTTCGFEVAKLNLTAFTGTVDLVVQLHKDYLDSDDEYEEEEEEEEEEEDTNYRWFTMVVGEDNFKHRIIVDEWNQYDDGEFYEFEKTICCAGTQKALEEALNKFYHSLPKIAKHRDNNVEIHRTYIQKFHLIGDLRETCEERDIKVITVYKCTEFPEHDKVNNNDDKQNPYPDAEPL